MSCPRTRKTTHLQLGLGCLRCYFSVFVLDFQILKFRCNLKDWLTTRQWETNEPDPAHSTKLWTQHSCLPLFHWRFLWRVEVNLEIYRRFESFSKKKLLTTIPLDSLPLSNIRLSRYFAYTSSRYSTWGRGIIRCFPNTSLDFIQ